MTPVEALVRRELGVAGPMTWARFMDLALYAPGLGYYEQRDRPIGRSGDFYTSVSVGEVFGFLVAWRVAGWTPESEPLRILEAGAHDGRLASDLLTALRSFHSGRCAGMEYWIQEPSAVARERQQRRLAGTFPEVRWVAHEGELPERWRGIVLSNELLDAFPVHRFVWRRSTGEWRELGIREADGALGWTDLDVPGWFEEQRRAYEPFEPHLPDGFVKECSPAALRWWRTWAARLAHGRLLTLDYGLTQALALDPARPGGTVRAYWKHTLEPDLLARPGEQDLTAQVDFPALIEAGEGCGLVTETFQAQGRWLGAVAVEILQSGGAAAAWLGERARGLQTLTHPSHLGAAFQVLVQRREERP